jgi:hypothetical protein
MGIHWGCRENRSENRMGYSQRDMIFGCLKMLYIRKIWHVDTESAGKPLDLRVAYFETNPQTKQKCLMKMRSKNIEWPKMEVTWTFDFQTIPRKPAVFFPSGFLEGWMTIRFWLYFHHTHYYYKFGFGSTIFKAMSSGWVTSFWKIHQWNGAPGGPVQGQKDRSECYSNSNSITLYLRGIIYSLYLPKLMLYI